MVWANTTRLVATDLNFSYAKTHFFLHPSRSLPLLNFKTLNTLLHLLTLPLRLPNHLMCLALGLPRNLLRLALQIRFIQPCNLLRLLSRLLCKRVSAILTFTEIISPFMPASESIRFCDELYAPVFSMPSTSWSDTTRSTFFAASLTVSMGPFWRYGVVEKRRVVVAAWRVRRAVRSIAD